jgi:hypothetical protein
VKEGLERRQSTLIARHKLHAVLIAQHQLTALAVFGDRVICDAAGFPHALRSPMMISFSSVRASFAGRVENIYSAACSDAAFFARWARAALETR